MNLVSKKYKVGVGDGFYPAGSKIIDSLIELAPVESIAVGGQLYNNGLAQTGITLDFGSVYTSTNGDIITVNFDRVIQITT